MKLSDAELSLLFNVLCDTDRCGKYRKDLFELDLLQLRVSKKMAKRLEKNLTGMILATGKLPHPTD